MNSAGGIDVGGTKIEATLFSADWQVLDSRRIATPTGSYRDLLCAIGDQVRWLETASRSGETAIGVGVPGLINRASGEIVMANLPVDGQKLHSDLIDHVNRPVALIKDCQAFTLSEAQLGAGRKYSSVLGLILGTGVAGGFAIDGALFGGKNGAAGEFGHIPMPANIVAEHDLAVLKCGCGKVGCYETLISGPGLSRLAQHVGGLVMTPPEIAKGAASGDETLIEIMDIWAKITCSLIRGLMLVVDPDCIVIGGGLSNIPGIDRKLAKELSNGLLRGMKVPPVLVTQGGDSSGARGAAMAGIAGGGNDRNT